MSLLKFGWTNALGVELLRLVVHQRPSAGSGTHRAATAEGAISPLPKRLRHLQILPG